MQCLLLAAQCRTCAALRETGRGFFSGCHMTRDEIITTDWARRFKEECPSQFEEAIAIAERAPVVDIVMTDEHSFRGDYKFVIIER